MFQDLFDFFRLAVLFISVIYRGWGGGGGGGGEGGGGGGGGEIVPSQSWSKFLIRAKINVFGQNELVRFLIGFCFVL